MTHPYEIEHICDRNKFSIPYSLLGSVTTNLSRIDKLAVPLILIGILVYRKNLWTRVIR